MEREWFVQGDTRTMGPFTLTELKQFVAEGRMDANTPVRKGRQGNWIVAAQIDGLFEQPRPAAAATRRLPPSAPKPSPPKPAVPKTQLATGPQSQPTIHPASIHEPVPASDSAFPLMVLVGVAVMAVLFISVVGIVLLSGNNHRQVARTPPKATPVVKAPVIAEPPPVMAKTPELSKQVTSVPAVLSTEQIVAKAEPSVAFIQGRSGIGTGFLIRPRIVATNRHVIENELIEEIQVHFPSAKTAGPYSAELLFADPDRDLAFLSVNTSLPPLELAPEEPFRRGQEVLAIGNPSLAGIEVLQNAVSRGLVSTKIVLDGHEFYQLNISINPGNSGGPVLNTAGQVVGVVTAKAKKEEGVAFCIPVQQLKNSLARQRQQSAQPDSEF